MAFNAREYWQTRLGERWSLAGVGRLGLGEGFNIWAYRVRRRAFLRLVGRLLPRTPVTAADIGSGTGFYVERWRELHAERIYGFDLTDVAVANLRAKYPDVPFTQLDITSERVGDAPDRLTAISIMDVLFHVTDDAAYKRAFANLSSWLAPGGLLIMSEFYVGTNATPQAHIAFRARRFIDEAATAAGLELIDCRPLLVLMNDPVDTTNRLHLVFWRILVAIARRNRLMGTVIGAALFPIETMLVTFFRYAPSTKLLMYRKSHLK